MEGTSSSSASPSGADATLQSSPATQTSSIDSSIPSLLQTELTTMPQNNNKSSSSSSPSSSSSSPRPLVPVTVLSGFLGAGKTTLLQHILMNRAGLKIGLIVNDMSEVNVDAALIAGGGESGIVRLASTTTSTTTDSTSSSSSSSSSSASTPISSPELVELSNGCICCTLREDLLSSMIKMASERRFDYLVIESSGISEPMPVAEVFTFQDETTGEALADHAKLDTMVTVVDAFHWLKDYDSGATLEDKKLAVAEGDTRGVVDLLVDQVEFANVIIVNKIDLLETRPKEEKERLLAILHTLNPDAKIIESVQGMIPLEKVLNTGLFSLTRASAAPGWLKELRGDHVPESLEYGISSFVFRSRRPFHPQRLFDLFASSGEGVVGTASASPLRAVIRSKGFAWIAIDGGMDESALWAHAGRIWQLSAGRAWWCTVPKSEWPQGMQSVIQQAISGNGSSSSSSVSSSESHGKESTEGGGGGAPHEIGNRKKYGDRGTEIVLIGVNMNREKVKEALEVCLVTEKEWKGGADVWDYYDDPFDFYAYEDEEEGDDDDGAEEEEKGEEQQQHVHGEGCAHGHGHGHSHGHSEETTQQLQSSSSSIRRMGASGTTVTTTHGTDVHDREGEGPKIFRLIAGST